jgi:hypothetical protein
MGDPDKLTKKPKKKSRKGKKHDANATQQVPFVKFFMPSDSGTYESWHNEVHMDSLIKDNQEEGLLVFIKENAAKVPLKAAEHFAEKLERPLEEVFPGLKEKFGKGSRKPKVTETAPANMSCPVDHDNIVNYKEILDVSQMCVPHRWIANWKTNQRATSVSQPGWFRHPNAPHHGATCYFCNETQPFLDDDKGFVCLRAECSMAVCLECHKQKNLTTDRAARRRRARG